MGDCFKCGRAWTLKVFNKKKKKSWIVVGFYYYYYLLLLFTLYVFSIWLVDLPTNNCVQIIRQLQITGANSLLCMRTLKMIRQLQKYRFAHAHLTSSKHVSFRTACRKTICCVYLKKKMLKNTKKATKVSFNIWQEYLREMKLSADELLASRVKLSAVLGKFYAEVRNLYTKTSLTSIRFSLQRFFSTTHTIDIVKDRSLKLPTLFFRRRL